MANTVICYGKKVDKDFLISEVRLAMALPLTALSRKISNQDSLLGFIAEVFNIQAQKAQVFIDAVQKDDDEYKKNVIKLGLSILKAGIAVFHLDELVDITTTLAELAADSTETIQDSLTDRLESVVDNIQGAFVRAHQGIFQSAEAKLLASADKQEVSLNWQTYRRYVYDDANETFDKIIQDCLLSDDFLWCVIKETIRSHPDESQETWIVKARETAAAYTLTVLDSLQEQIDNIKDIHIAVSSKEGQKKIEHYFRQLCLINLLLSREKTGGLFNGWLTKKMGHTLSFYFPKLVHQAKWSPVRAYGMLRIDVTYAKQKITAKEYRALKAKAPVKLSLVSNSASKKRKLYSELNDLPPSLNDALIRDLRDLSKEPLPEKDAIIRSPSTTIGKRSARYSLSSNKERLFTPLFKRKDTAEQESSRPKFHYGAIFTPETPKTPETPQGLPGDTASIDLMEPETILKKTEADQSQEKFDVGIVLEL